MLFFCRAEVTTVIWRWAAEAEDGAAPGADEGEAVAGEATATITTAQELVIPSVITSRVLRNGARGEAVGRVGVRMEEVEVMTEEEGGDHQTVEGTILAHPQTTETTEGVVLTEAIDGTKSSPCRSR